MDAKLSKEGPAQDIGVESTIGAERYITGLQLHVITLGVLVAVFIAQMEASITSTSILNITNDLGGYEKSSWVFTAYMLTYCGFPMIWAKLSDIAGRKPTLITALGLFVAFSGACGGSQSMIQLIMFRWVQGIGGCGVFAMSQLIFFELVPPSKWPMYVSLVTGVIALALVVAPLLGGAISDAEQWRWIFLLNVPTGSVAILGIFFSLPSRLWNEPAASHAQNDGGMFSMKSLSRIDVLGSLLLLGSCILISTGLQQAALGHAWISGFVLPLLVCTIPFVTSFFAWQRHITLHKERPEPVFPWRFVQNRIRIGIILNSFFMGVVIYVAIVQIPQRFITVNGMAPFDAAVRLLPFGAFIPVGSSVAAGLMGKPKMRPSHILIAGSALQIVGTVLLSRTSTSPEVHNTQYGYQILLGTGLGFVNGALTLLVPYVMENRDLAVGTASVAQFRVLGGLIGLAIAASISTPYIRSHIGQNLPPNLTQAILEKTGAIHLLPERSRIRVQEIFGEGYNIQMKLLIGFAAAQMPTTVLMWTNVVVSGREIPNR